MSLLITALAGFAVFVSCRSVPTTAFHYCIHYGRTQDIFHGFLSRNLTVDHIDNGGLASSTGHVTRATAPCDQSNG